MNNNLPSGNTELQYFQNIKATPLSLLLLFSVSLELSSPLSLPRRHAQSRFPIPEKRYDRRRRQRTLPPPVPPTNNMSGRTNVIYVSLPNRPRAVAKPAALMKSHGSKKKCTGRRKLAVQAISWISSPFPVKHFVSCRIVDVALKTYFHELLPMDF